MGRRQRRLNRSRKILTALDCPASSRWEPALPGHGVEGAWGHGIASACQLCAPAIDRNLVAAGHAVHWACRLDGATGDGLAKSGFVLSDLTVSPGAGSRESSTFSAIRKDLSPLPLPPRKCGLGCRLLARHVDGIAKRVKTGARARPFELVQQVDLDSC